MPRKRRAARAYRDGTRSMSRAEVVKALVDSPFSRISPEMAPVLKHVPRADWGALIQEADEIAGAEAYQRRLPTLRQRLNEWHVDQWGGVFAEAPELRDELTPEKLARWTAWLAEAKRRRLAQTQENILKFPPPESTTE